MKKKILYRINHTVNVYQFFKGSNKYDYSRKKKDEKEKNKKKRKEKAIIRGRDFLPSQVFSHIIQ